MIWLFLVVLFSFLLIGIPVAFGMLVSAIAMLLALGVFDTQIIAQKLISGANSFSLMAIPFFILTGEIMNKGGISLRIVNLASALVGHKRGGLGYIAIISGMIFASLSGSAVADTAALGAILIPMMVSRGYHKNNSTGLIAASGMLGTVLPPSIPMILLGAVGGVSVTRLFMGGIVPGILMAIGISFTWYLVSKKDLSTVLPKASKKEVWKAFISAIWALFLPVIIIVGLRGGIFTPTEAGVVAAVYALIISLGYREITFSEILDTFLLSAKTTGIVMFLAATATVVAYVITIAQIPAELANTLTQISDHPTVLLIIIMGLLLIVGAVMDLTPAVLIFTPVLLPVVVSVGIDPVYFGILMIINLSIGLITPPIGTVLYVAAGISESSIVEVTKGVWPFVLTYIFVLLLLVIFPSLIMVPLEFIMS